MVRKGFLATLGMFGLALSVHGLGMWLHCCPPDLAALKNAMPRWKIPPGMDRYDMKIRHVFAEAFGPNVEFRELGTGGMLEIATFIRGNEWIELRTAASASVWDHEHLELVLDGNIRGWGADGRPLSTEKMVRRSEIRFPLSMGNYPVIRRAALISPEFKKRILAVCQDALEHARRGQYNVGVDGGTSTYFLRTADRRVLAGSIWSPEAGPARMLNEVVYHASGSFLSDGKYATDLDQAINAYWEAARQRTSKSVELDHHPADLGLRPPQAYQ